jgi:hypothetical protein
MLALQASAVNIDPPSAADDFESSDEDHSDDEADDRPLTREELAARTARKLGAQGGGQSRVGALRLRAPRRAGK